MTNELDERVRQALYAWFNLLPAGVAAIQEQAIDGLGVHVVPTKQGCTDVMVAFSGGDTVDIHWGDGFQVEQIRSEPDFVVQVCEAIRRGRLRVERWTLAGATILTKGTIDVGSERLDDRLLATLSFLKQFAIRSVEYGVPWDPETVC